MPALRRHLLVRLVFGSSSIGRAGPGQVGQAARCPRAGAGHRGESSAAPRFSPLPPPCVASGRSPSSLPPTRSPSLSLSSALPHPPPLFAHGRGLPHLAGARSHPKASCGRCPFPLLGFLPVLDFLLGCELRAGRTTGECTGGTASARLPAASCERTTGRCAGETGAGTSGRGDGSCRAWGHRFCRSGEEWVGEGERRRGRARAREQRGAAEGREGSARGLGLGPGARRACDRREHARDDSQPGRPLEQQELGRATAGRTCCKGVAASLRARTGPWPPAPPPARAGRPSSRGVRPCHASSRPPSCPSRRGGRRRAP